MNRVIIIYILTIITIAVSAIFMHSSAVVFPTIGFPHSLHIILEGTNSLLMFLIFLVSNYLFFKTNDERLVILAGGFLLGGIWNCVHIITVTTFPFDLLSLDNIQNNPTLIYLLLSNLILPLAIYVALTHKPTNISPKEFGIKIYSIYFFIFLTLTALPILINNFLPDLFQDFILIIHSLEFVNYLLYVTLAFIVINIRLASKVTFFATFTTGLIIMGFSGLFYINPDVLPLDGILAHVIQAIGLIFLVFGINKLVLYTRYLRFKDELVAHLCLVLIMFYVVFITTISVLLHIEFPPISAYIFIEFILLFQFIVYLLINKVNQPITNIIDSLDNYSPGKESVEIPIIRNDELGMLSEKINAVSKLSFQKILEVSKMAERNRSIIRIFESIQRVSNQDIIKNSIVEEIKNALNPDRIAIALYNKAEDSFYYDKYIENLPSQTLMDFEGKNPETKMIQRLNDFLKNSLELCYSNLDDYITSNSLQGTQREKVLRIYGIKSCCNIPIYFAGNLLGCLLIQYTKESITFDETDLNYLKTMATQLGVIINTQR